MAYPSRRLAWSPDGRRLAVEVSGPDTCKASPVASACKRIWLLSADGRNRRLVGRGTDPSVAPDGRRLVWERDGNIVVASTATGVARTLTRGRLPAWTPDGRIAYTDAHGWIWRMNRDGTHRIRLVRGAEPAFSPDGRRLAFVAAGRGVVLKDLRDRHEPFVGRYGYWPVWSRDGRRLAYVESGAAIVVTTRDARRVARLRVGTDSLTAPVWHGRRLLYAGGR